MKTKFFRVCRCFSLMTVSSSYSERRARLRLAERCCQWLSECGDQYVEVGIVFVAVEGDAVGESECDG